MFHSPSIVPEETDVYLVLDDFGNRLGRICSETDEADTDRATLISYLLQGQYANPARIVVFNTVEGWSRDATEEIVAELVELCRDRDEVPLWLGPRAVVLGLPAAMPTRVPTLTPPCLSTSGTEAGAALFA